MLQFELKDFDIGQIADSGQCFRMYEIGEGYWEVFALNNSVRVKKKLIGDRKIHTFDCSDDEFYGFWFNYFDLQTNYGTIKDRILATKDDYLCKAVRFGDGVRILRQDTWEMIVSFVISQQNNIPRIKSCLEKICDLNDGLFPTPAELLDMRGEKLESVKLGYREEYLLQIAKDIVNKKFSIETLKAMSYVEAMEYLMTLHGVGEKVANCISLFGLHHIEAFPIDIWMKNIIEKYYNGHFDLKSLNLEDIGGIVQQYMYFFERMRGTI